MTDEPPDIADFIAARLGEMASREAIHDGYAEGCPADTGRRGGVCDCGAAEINAEHRAAAEGLRALVGEHNPLTRGSFVTCEDCCNVDRDGTVTGYPWPCRTRRHVAAIWQGHPDYRTEWTL